MLTTLLYLCIIMIMAYNKQQYRIRIASDYRGHNHWILSRHSPEHRRHRRRLLLHLNRRKVEAFIHCVMYFRWPLCLPQLGTSIYMSICIAGVERGPSKIFGVSCVQGLF